jgi:ribosomal protein L24E
MAAVLFCKMACRFGLEEINPGSSLDKSGHGLVKSGSEIQYFCEAKN